MAAVTDSPWLLASGSHSVDPERTAELRALLARVAVEIGRLGPSHRRVIVLGPVLGLSYDRISQLLSLTPTVVKGRLHRARERLRRALWDVEGVGVPALA